MRAAYFASVFVVALGCSATNATIVVRKGKQTLRIDQYVAGLPETTIENLGKVAASRL